MNDDRNKNLNPDPVIQTETRRSAVTPPPAQRGFGVPLLIAAFILIAALAGLILATPKQVNDDSVMPMASTEPMNEPGIEPAAQGNTQEGNTTGTATTEAASVTGTTTADTNAAVVTPNSSITPPVVYATQDACEDANNDATCFKQACDTISSVRCPEGATEGWSPSATFNDTDNGTTGTTATDNTMNPATNNAIPPAENPAAPRNDGIVNTPATTTPDANQNSGTGTTGSMESGSTGTTAPTTTP